MLRRSFTSHLASAFRSNIILRCPAPAAATVTTTTIDATSKKEAATTTTTTPSASASSSESTTSSSAASSEQQEQQSANNTSSSSSSSSSAAGHLIHSGMRVSAFVSAGPTVPVAIGNVVAQLAENLYSVRFEVPDSGTVVEVGTRVVAEKEDGTASAGLVAHVYGDGTFSILYDDDILERNVPRNRISISGGRLAMSQGALAKYEGVVNWIREAGVQKRIDILSAAIVLYRRGWRSDNMYLLEAEDVHCLRHLNKSVRQGILEQAEDEKMKRRVNREMQHEALKEKQNWSYRLQKYAGIVGAVASTVGIASIFFWNYKNYERQLRPNQIRTCVANVLSSISYNGPGGGPEASTTKIGRFSGSFFHNNYFADDHVQRRDTDRLCRFIDSIAHDHPQLIFLTGVTGCGKSTCMRDAARALGCPFVIVELRGSEKQDPIRAVAKAMGVTSIELCGDLFGFVNEVCGELKRISGKLPVIILKPKGTEFTAPMFLDHATMPMSTGGGGGGDRGGGSSFFSFPSAFGGGGGGGGSRSGGGGGGSLSAQSAASASLATMGYVFNDALSLVTERRAANIVVELDTDALTNLPHLPRTSIFHVDDMTREEAVAYLGHRIDPVAITELLDTVGTNTIELDECVSAVRHHEIDMDDYICNKLSQAIATIRRQPLDVQTVLSEVAQQPFHVGVRKRLPKMEEAVARGFLMYHWEQQGWTFRSKVLYEASKVVGAWD